MKKRPKKKLEKIVVRHKEYEITVSPQVIKSTLKRYGLGMRHIREHRNFLEEEIEEAIKDIELNGRKLYPKSDNLNFTLEKTKGLSYRVIGARINRDYSTLYSR